MRQTLDKALWADLDDQPASVAHRVVLFRLVLMLGGRLRARMDQRYREAGITTQQAAVLAIARAAAAPLRQGEVARQLGVSHQNVRQIANALEAKGLLESRPDPKDGRSKLLAVTRRAAPLFARRNRRDFTAVAGWFATISDEEAAELAALLERVLIGVDGPARDP